MTSILLEQSWVVASGFQESTAHRVNGHARATLSVVNQVGQARVQHGRIHRPICCQAQFGKLAQAVTIVCVLKRGWVTGT